MKYFGIFKKRKDLCPLAVHNNIVFFFSLQLKFFEISPLSFVKKLGKKWREGPIKKCSGGRRISIGCCGCLKKFHFAGNWKRR